MSTFYGLNAATESCRLYERRAKNGMKILSKRISGHRKIELSRHDPENTLGLSKDKSDLALEKYKSKLFFLQTLLYAERKHSILVVLQGTDAGGKDGLIRNVFSGIHPRDAEERNYWNIYQEAYQDAVRKCHTPWAPWYVIPADRKWARNLAVAQILTEAIEGLKMKRPKLRHPA